ncbi:MAG: hypothetical protein IPF96_13005 [Rhodobacter sp.]|nr:hypothetical protein [Rhodobacter sp.]
MHLCFIDESGTPAKLGKAEPSTFAIGAIIIPEATWQNVRKKLLGLKISSKYNGEVKWRYFAPSNTDDDNPMLGWEQVRKDEFRSAVFKIITDQGSIWLLACVWHCKTAYENASITYPKRSPISDRPTNRITQRAFQYFPAGCSRSSGEEQRFRPMIVADHRGRQDQKRMPARTRASPLERTPRPATSGHRQGDVQLLSQVPGFCAFQRPGQVRYSAFSRYPRASRGAVAQSEPRGRLEILVI